MFKMLYINRYNIIAGELLIDLIPNMTYLSYKTSVQHIISYFGLSQGVVWTEGGSRGDPRPQKFACHLVSG